MNPKRCGGCRYFQADDKDANKGHCHHRPPIVISQFISYRPRVGADDLACSKGDSLRTEGMAAKLATLSEMVEAGLLNNQQAVAELGKIADWKAAVGDVSAAKKLIGEAVCQHPESARSGDYCRGERCDACGKANP